MILLVDKFQRNDFNYSLHLLDSCLLHYLLSSDSKAITLGKGAIT